MGDVTPVLGRWLHHWRCKPRRAAAYGETYDCPHCGQRWVSTISFGGPCWWRRQGRNDDNERPTRDQLGRERQYFG